MSAPTEARIGRVDITCSQHLDQGSIGGRAILSKHKGRDWTVEQDAELADIITAACALLEFSEQPDESD